MTGAMATLLGSILAMIALVLFIQHSQRRQARKFALQKIHREGTRTRSGRPLLMVAKDFDRQEYEKLEELWKHSNERRKPNDNSRT